MADFKISRIFVRVVLFLTVMEICSFLLVKAWGIYDQEHKKEILQEEKQTGELLAGGNQVEVIHPYLGYVYSPETEFKGPLVDGETIGVTSFGFLDIGSPIRSRDSETVIVGIFGGSVAYWFSVLGWDTFRSQLENFPGFREKKIVPVRVAIGGYKQPQQLLALNLLLTLGGEFDIVINLDGFNEVALPFAELRNKGTAAFFPRNWSARVRDLSDPGLERLYRKSAFYSVFRNKLDTVEKTGYPYTVRLLALTVRDIVDNWDRINNRRILEYRSEKGRYIAMGPVGIEPGNEDKYFENLALVWRRASEQMRKVCEENGIKYFHFLQPNQYVPGSRNFTKEEEKIFFKNHPYKTAVEKGYPFLVREGGILREEGVSFFDMTMLFKFEPETVYHDACCHLNIEGNKILARRMAEVILESLNGG